MLMIQCNGCRASAFADCGCPPGHDAGALGHLPEITVGGQVVPACPMGDLDALVTCEPGAGCCDGKQHPGLSHGQAAHLGHPNMAAAMASGQASWEPDHDGDHAVENDDCAVCRPVTIVAMPGSAVLQQVAGG